MTCPPPDFALLSGRREVTTIPLLHGLLALLLGELQGLDAAHAAQQRGEEACAAADRGKPSKPQSPRNEPSGAEQQVAKPYPSLVQATRHDEPARVGKHRCVALALEALVPGAPACMGFN